jgi:hypothetical protein
MNKVFLLSIIVSRDIGGEMGSTLCSTLKSSMVHEGKDVKNIIEL